MKIADLNFFGIADRIDFSEDGLTIVDYKTGKTKIPAKNRDLQLGYYALAAEQQFGNVKRIILDMLRQNKPMEFIVDNNGNAKDENSKVVFNINDIKRELSETAQKIIVAYKNGFRPCPKEKECEFCKEYVI